MTLQQLTYFLASAEHGSFSAAAESLHMAQPSLSEQIRRLEAELGVPLFARAGRRLELTEAGRLLLPEAERTLAARAGRQESVREVRDVTGGTVAFGTFGSAHHYLLGGLIEEFRRRHPSVRCAWSARTRPRSPTRSATATSRPASSCSRSTTAASTCARRCRRSCSTSRPSRAACASR